MEFPNLSLFALQLKSQFFGLVVKLHQSSAVVAVAVVATAVVVVVVVVGEGQVIGGHLVFILVLATLRFAAV